MQKELIQHRQTKILFRRKRKMKKSVAVLMILALVLSLSASAFAAFGSAPAAAGDYYDYDGTYYPDFYPPGQGPRERQRVVQTDVGLLICLMEDDTVYQFVPMPQVVNVEYKNREQLRKEDAEALKEAHDAAKQIEGKSLKQSYFFTVPSTYTVDEEHYAKYVFSCPGNNVEVSVNGNPVEVVSINGRTSYVAKVTERGCITITVDK
jgi:hypothetical protein